MPRPIAAMRSPATSTWAWLTRWISARMVYTFALLALAVLGMRMSVRSWSYPLVLSIVALVATLPAPARAAGDAQKGKAISYTCLGCHGIPDYNNVYPTY